MTKVVGIIQKGQKRDLREEVVKETNRKNGDFRYFNFSLYSFLFLIRFKII